MKERPILFSSPMVKAILAGQKTQTRRLVKPQPEPIPDDVERVKPYDDSGFWWVCAKVRSAVSMHDAPCLGPYGYKRDRLWVKERFATIGHGRDFGVRIRYAATPEREDHVCLDPAPDREDRWRPTSFGNDRPSIHMPRWASRITLEVTEVRVQRLQDISEEDAKAEGVEPLKHVGADQPFDDGSHRTQGNAPYTLAFAVLWDAINGERASWASNPWCWCVSFRRLP